MEISQHIKDNVKGLTGILGLSGGRDSVALACLLKENNIPFIAVHINHLLRGAESFRDERFVKVFCEKMDIPLIVYRVDVKGFMKTEKGSVETIARNVRREVFQKLIRENKGQYILLAHHANDQVETALFKMCRGSNGLKGMREIDYVPLRTVRPLLRFTRWEITKYLYDKQQRWVDDGTNDEDEVSRNIIRHKVVPALTEAMGRDIVQVASRTIRNSMGTIDAFGEMYGLLSKQFLDKDGRLYLPWFDNKSLNLTKNIVGHYIHCIVNRNLDDKQLEEIAKSCKYMTDKTTWDIKGGTVKRKEKRLFIVHK